MAKRKHTTNPSASEPVFRIAHLFRDPVLQRAFGAAEDGLDGAPALPAPSPPPKNDPLAEEIERICFLFGDEVATDLQEEVASTIRRVVNTFAR